jgi:hypothetical protein
MLKANFIFGQVLLNSLLIMGSLLSNYHAHKGEVQYNHRWEKLLLANFFTTTRQRCFVIRLFHI